MVARYTLSLLLIAILVGATRQMPPVTNGWLLFEKVKYTEKFYKNLNEYYLTPFFDSKIRHYENHEIQLKGHYLPFDLDEKNVIIISKFPYSACFFCGGAGPESVAEIRFKEKHPHFKTDQVITVSGKLILNDTDINHMNFILADATLVKK